MSDQQAFAHFESAWTVAHLHYANAAPSDQLPAAPGMARSWLVSLTHELGTNILNTAPVHADPKNPRSEEEVQSRTLEANIEAVHETAHFVRMAHTTGAKTVVAEYVTKLRSHANELAAELGSNTDAVAKAAAKHQKRLTGALGELRALEKEVAGKPLAQELFKGNWKEWTTSIAHPPKVKKS